MKHLQYRKIVGPFQTALHTFCTIGIFFLLLAVPSDANSQTRTLHALLVIMDADENPNFGNAMEVNQANLENLLTIVDREADVIVRTQHFLSSANMATKTRIMEWLENTAFAKDDIVLVYFSGTGGRTAPQTETQSESFVHLQDGELLDPDFVSAVQRVAAACLKLLIIDRCYPELRESMESIRPDAPPISDDQRLIVKHLFEEHAGFLHLTGTSDYQVGWTDREQGSIFTAALIDSISRSSVSDVDKNRDGFVDWQEIFERTRQTTHERFQSGHAKLSKALREDLRRRGIDAQTPVAHALPKPVMPAPTEPKNPLWALTNANASFDVYLKTERNAYQIDDYLKLNVLTEHDAHIVIFNSDESGRLTILFPNTYQSDNFIESDTHHQIPDARADFDIRLPGPPGLEKLKLIALRNRTDSKAVLNYFPWTDKGFRVITDSERTRVEKRILSYLQRMNPRDWTAASQTFEIQKPIRPDYSIGDIVHVEYDGYKYFARVTDRVEADAETVSVRIYNREIREELGRTIPTALVTGKRTVPEQGWGKQKVILSFYRDGEWITTRHVLVFEDYFMLPEKIDGESVRGSRQVEFDEVRIPIFKRKNVAKEHR